MTAPPYLDHFFEAHEAMYGTALAELKAGKKRSHWIWFIFPQCRGIGRSAMAEYYAILSLEEARAFLLHPVLGANLRTCVSEILLHSCKDLKAIVGGRDARKIRSSLTLFKHASDLREDQALMGQALDVFFGGEECPRTLEFLSL
tara:strand:- start:220 stop:654 length:435 start_codon:yes stop_codon:yes gene_type:complete